jgi:hypothetical protein
MTSELKMTHYPDRRNVELNDLTETSCPNSGMGREDEKTFDDIGATTTQSPWPSGIDVTRFDD